MNMSFSKHTFSGWFTWLSRSFWQLLDSPFFFLLLFGGFQHLSRSTSTIKGVNFSSRYCSGCMGRCTKIWSIFQSNCLPCWYLQRCWYLFATKAPSNMDQQVLKASHCIRKQKRNTWLSKLLKEIFYHSSLISS